MLSEIAKLTGMHRFTVTKYVHELMGAGFILQKSAAAARICYLKETFVKNGNKIGIRNLLYGGNYQT